MSDLHNTATANTSGLIVKNNTISAQGRCAWFNNLNGGVFDGNEFRLNQTVASGTINYGLWTNNAATGTINIFNNRFTQFTTKETGAFGMRAVSLSSGATYNIYNNTFAGMDKTSTSSAALNLTYLFYSGVTGSKIFNNTFYMPALTNATHTGGYYAAIQLSGNTAEIRNNIFISDEATHTNPYFISAVPTPASDNNIFNIRQTNANHKIVAAHTTLAAYQVAQPTKDINSKNKNVLFQNTTTSDLSLTSTSIQDVDLAVPRQASVTTDILGKSRYSVTYAGAHQPDAAHFRSAASGNINDATKWQASLFGTAWDNAFTAPTVNGTTVTVRNGHEITVNAATNATNLVVNGGGRLNVNSGTTLNATNLSLQSDASNGTATLINNGTITISGTTTAEQHLAHTRNWYVSSPLSAAVVPASGYTIYRRNEAGATWLPAVTNPSTFAAGVGYIALPGSAASTLSFSGGTLNSGNVEVALTNSGTSAKGFNLVGNPYPAHLTWTKAFTDANEALIQPTIWYRTNAGTVNNSGQWSFQTFNAFSGAAVPETTTGVIPPMQAFWVNAIAPGTLTFNNLLTRSHQSNNPLKAPAVAQNTNQQLRLELTNGTASDELLIYFHEQAQNIFDRYDSPKFADANASVQLYSSVGNNQLVINGMSSEFSNTEVYLGFRTTAAGSYQLRPFSIQHFDPAVRILLRDNLLNTETDITGGESYAFNTTETTSDSRFSLLFRAPGATTDAPSATLANLSVYGSMGRIVVEGARLAENKARILLYNQTGQLLKEMVATGNRTEVGNRFVQGVYLVVVEAEGRKTTHKLIMK